MKQPLFSGVCTAMITPFLDGKVNYPMLEVLLRRQIEAGISAVVLCGTTGEAPTLTDAEKLEIIRRSKAFAGDSLRIIAGTGSNDTTKAVTMSSSAAEAGADGLLLVSPYYNKATADGLYAHFLTIAQSVALPIILYNVPTRTGVDIPVSVYRRLSMLPNIAGVKEASTDIRKILQIRAECPKEFCVWAGNDDMIVPVMSLGGQGVVSVLSNLYPAETNAMAMAAYSGDFETAASLQIEFSKLTQALFSEVNPIPVKAAMRLLGYDCGNCRMPLTPAAAETITCLQEAL